jgi:hypothetical protein
MGRIGPQGRHEACPYAAVEVFVIDHIERPSAN